jgi:hypothetical protein
LVAAGAKVPEATRALAEKKGHACVVTELDGLAELTTRRNEALDAAMAALQWGKDAEASARPAEALELYHTGLAALVAHIRVEPDPAKREILTGVINDMMANAERLKTEFTLDGDGAAGDSTPHRVYIHGSIYALTFSKNSWTFSRDLQTLQHV